MLGKVQKKAPAVRGGGGVVGVEVREGGCNNNPFQPLLLQIPGGHRA